MQTTETGYVRDWEKLASLDAEFAVLSHGHKRFGAWSQDDFYQTGSDEIDSFYDDLARLGAPSEFKSALDFGCGLGRLSLALRKRIPEVVGVDVSPTMVERSRGRFGEVTGLRFVLNQTKDLAQFADGSFDLVFSLITLQHIGKKEWVQGFLREFTRVLRPGGVLYFQLPSVELYPPWKKPLLQLRGRFFHWLVASGVPEQFCYRRLRIEPFMNMTFMTVAETKQFFAALGCTCDLVCESTHTTKTKYLVRKPA